MSERDSKKKKKKGAVAEVLSWRQKKEMADAEEAAVGKDVNELVTWTSLIESMNEKELKDYVQNRPEHMQSVQTAKSTPGKRVQRSGKSKCSSSSHGLMASIWKFHKEED